MIKSHKQLFLIAVVLSRNAQFICVCEDLGDSLSVTKYLQLSAVDTRIYCRLYRCTVDLLKSVTVLSIYSIYSY